VSVLEIEGLTYRYPSGIGRAVVDDLSMAVDVGEIVAIVGESGCGKSTLGKLIVGLLRPSAGTVYFEGNDIWSLGRSQRRTWRRAVQLIHQDPYGSLNPGLTIGSTLGPALLYNNLATRRTLVSELLRILGQVGLDASPSFLARYPHQLSGGQRQRVAIARAVSLQPRIVVADEVTSMLDVSMRVAILDLLLAVRAERKLTYVFISHDLGVVRYFAQGGRVLVMFYGVIVEEGATEEIILRPRHPYTYLLLQAVPIPDPALAERHLDDALVDRLEGEPSDIGCVFSNRCPFAEQLCHESQPPAVELGPGHWVACYFPDRVPAATHLQKGFDDGQTRGSLAHHNGLRSAHYVAPRAAGGAL